MFANKLLHFRWSEKLMSTKFAYLLLALTCIAGTRECLALQPADIWQYCTSNYAGTQACFNSLDEAETYMRTENPSGPSGRRFLELTGGPTFAGAINNPSQIAYGYSVKNRGLIAYDEDYIKADLITSAATGYICGCPNQDGSGTAVCLSYGESTNCSNQPGNCYSCKAQNGDPSSLDQAIETLITNLNGCNLSTSATDWPDPADSAGPSSTINDLSLSPPWAFLSYNNTDADDTQYGNPIRAPFNRVLSATYGTMSNGQCINVQLRSRWQFDRAQHVECDPGLTEFSGIVNPQNFYYPPQYQIIPISQLCHSSATGQIIAKLIPSAQCTYGDPCVPGNGSQIEDEIDYSWGSFSIERHYNSLRLATSNSYLGTSWHIGFDKKLVIPSGTSSSYVLLIDPRGDIERFDKQGSTTTYRSVNIVGSVLNSVTSGSTTSWQLLTERSEIWTFSSTGILQSTQILNRPETLKTYTYGPLNAPTGDLLVPAGALQTITDALGRSIAFNYSSINDAGVCSSAGTGPACSGLRLTSVELPDGSSIAYTYDLSGNLSAVTYPDGNGKQYFYNESANICPSSMPAACAGGSAPPGGFPYLLTGISDISIASGSPVATRFSTYQYDYRGRTISSSRAQGADQVTLSYSTQTRTLLNFAYGQVGAGGMNKTIDFGTVGGMFRKESANQDADPVSGSIFLTQFTYDSSGRLQNKKDPLNYQRIYEYSNGLNITATSETDASGNLQRRVETDWNSTFDVPTERRIKSASGAIEATTRWAYNTRGQAFSRCDIDPAVSGASSYTCGSATNAPVGVRQWTYTYCESAGVTAGTCPLVGLTLGVDGPRTDVTDVTTYTYYQTTDLSGCAALGGTCHYLGDLQTVSNALNQATTYVSYDKNGRPTRIQDANGTYIDVTYHPRGWLLTRTVRANADGIAAIGDAVTTFAYDSVGNVSQVTQPDGDYLTYTYDAAHRLADIRDNLSNHIHYTLDAAANRTVEQTYDPSTALKQALTRQYDQLNHLVAQLNAATSPVRTYTNPAEAPPTGTTYLNGYNGNGNAIYSIDGTSNHVGTEQQYDPLNRLLKTLQDHAGTGATHDTTTQYAYDARDNLRSVIDPDNLTTSYTYDGLNNLTQLSSPDTGTTTYTYDAAGNRITQTDARGVLTTYTYDALNRLTSINYPTSSLNVTFQYDQFYKRVCTLHAAGRLTQITDSSGGTAYCYDRHGNVTQKVQLTTGQALEVDYGYTKGDRLQRITYPSSAVVTYSRNAIGQITTVTYKQRPIGSPATTLIQSATYLPFGPLNALTFGNGRTLTKNYDQDYAIDKVVSSDSSGLIIEATVDVLGNLINASNSVGASPPTQQYQYDPLYRLTSVQTGTGTSLLDLGYDLTGDRTTKTPQGMSAQSYGYDVSTHHLTSVAGAARSVDANGNTTLLNGTTLNYDDRNRLQAAGTVTYNYNGKGERVRKSSPATIFVYAENGMLLGEYNGTGAVQREYIPMDNVLVGAATSSSLYYVETDQLGTPRQVIQPGTTPATDTTVWKWDYFANNSAFGENTPSVQTITFNLRFPGQYFDSETGLNYNYFRDYEAGTGRYVQSDPIGLDGGINTYSYAYASALNYSDPSGLAGKLPRGPPNPKPRAIKPPQPDPSKPSDLEWPPPEVPPPSLCTLAGLFVTICPPVLKCILWDCHPPIDPFKGCTSRDPEPYIFMHGPKWRPQNDPYCRCQQFAWTDY